MVAAVAPAVDVDVDVAVAVAAAGAGASAAPTWSVGEALASQYTGVPTAAETAAAAQHAPTGVARESIPGMAKSVADSMGGIEDLRKGREYAVAWGSRQPKGCERHTCRRRPPSPYPRLSGLCCSCRDL